MADPYYSMVATLMHFDAMLTPTRMYDSAPVPASIVVPSSGVKITATQKKFGDGSCLFDGGYIWLGSVADPQFIPGASKDFCIESWCYDVGGGNRRVLFGNSESGGGGGTLSILLTTSNTFSVGVTIAGTQYLIQPATTTPLNTWYHLALVRYGTALTLYLNGTSIGSVTVPTGAVTNPTGRFSIGSAGLYLGYGGTYGVQWMGYLDDFRFTIGNARYTGNFTPPVSAFEPNDPPPPPSFYSVRNKVSRMVGSTYPQRQLKIRRIGRKVPFFFYKDNAGNGVVSGVVTIENIPGSRRVRLYRKQDGMLIRETWSAANGAYSFNNIDPAWEYFVVAHDHLRVHNGVIQDMLVP